MRGFRWTALALCALLLTGCAAREEETGKELYRDITGMPGNTVLLTAEGRKIPAWRYCYWLAYDCDYLSSYMGTVDFDAAVSESMSFGQYAMEDAQRTVTLYSVVRAWAEQAGITLSEDSQAQLDAQRQQYVDYYGGEEGYAKQLELMGLTDEGFQRINEVYFLYSELYGAYCSEDGALRPSAEEIGSFAQENKYYTFLPLHWSFSGDTEADSAAAAKAQAAAERLSAAADKTAVYLQIAQEMAQQATETGETLSAADLDSGIAEAVAALQENEVSGVVTTASGCYVFVGKALNTDAVLDKMFNARLDTLRDSAAIRYNCRSYGKLNVGTFYTKLQTLRSQLQSASSGDTQS